MTNLQEYLNSLDSFLWGIPLILMLVGVGGFLTFKLKWIQFRKIKYGIKSIIKHQEEVDAIGDVNGIASLFLALAATVGMGNVIGVAAAIKMGGAGALFWMWIAGLLGMATQYSEALLSIKYRIVDEKGHMLGGPMIYIDKGLNKPLLGKIFAFFAILTAIFGTGNISQTQTIVEVFNKSFNIPISITAFVLGLIIAFVAFSGIRNLTRMAVVTVPFIISLYVLGALVLIVVNIELLPKTIIEIFSSAFSFKSIGGGLAGTAISLAIKEGFRRGTFSNEAGMGSTPIAAATAKTSFAAHQGTIFMLVTFIDTIIINTLTGFLILFSNTHKMGISTSEMVYSAFNISFGAFGFGEVILTVSIVFFTFTTLITWQYYGERCVVYLFGYKAVNFYKMIFILVVIFGGYLSVDLIWIVADIGNALMLVPNLIALIMLSPVIVSETRLYFNDI